MTLVEKPLKTHKSVPSLRELANTEDAVWYKPSKYQQTLPVRTLRMYNVDIVEDAQWRKLTPLEMFVQPMTKFFKR